MRTSQGDIGKRIRKRRIELGWSQVYLAKVSGLTRVYICYLENGRIKNPSMNTVKKLSHCLGLKLGPLWV